MKVLCINGEAFEQHYNCPKKRPITGIIYTVLRSLDCSCGCGTPMYILEEFPENHWWAQQCFAPISDIDETELLEKRKSKENA